MKKKQVRNHLQLLIVLAMVLITLATFAVGKYIRELSFHGKVTFTANLAKNVILQEHLAVRQPDGSYQ